jgi:methionyl aminopeptidase
MTPISKLPARLSVEDLEEYRRVGPAFGKLLTSIYQEVLTGKLLTGEEVRIFFEWSASKITNRASFPFVTQLNQYSEAFGYSICSSLNNCVAHGRPDKKKFKPDDIVSLDFGLAIPSKTHPARNLHFDAAFTICKRDNEQRLVKAPLDFLKAVLKYTNQGYRSTIYKLWVENVCSKYDVCSFNVVNDLCGHSIGYSLHEEPLFPNLSLLSEEYPCPSPDTVICLEPMLTDGYNCNVANVYVDSDGWSVMAEKPASHWETMFLIKKDGSLTDLLGLTRIGE